MNILIHGYLGKYGSMGQWVLDGMSALGHDVTGCDRLKTVDNIGDYDLYVAVDCSEDYSNNIPSGKITKVCWLMDTQMPGGLERSLNIANKCDYVVSTNKEYGQDILNNYGVPSLLVPVTYNDLYVKENKKNLDVCMIGHPNSGERIRLWEMLGKYNGYCGVAETKEDFVDYMSRAKVVVNQPTEPWDIILNNRFFEGLAYNSLLLQKRLKTTLIEDLGFIAGEDFLYWDSLDQVVPMIDAILSGYKGFDKIIKSGNKKVKEFALTKQLSKILKYVNEN